MRSPKAPIGYFVHGRCGFGDNIYWRPLVRVAAAVMPTWVETPYPELFRDIANVRCTPPRTRLRTQMKAIAAHRRTGSYTSAPPVSRVHRLDLKYSWRDLEAPGGSLLATMERCLPVPCDPFVFDLPDLGASPIDSGKPIALVRPVTERTEWLNKARNPRAEYVAEAAEILRARGFHVVLVADLQPGKEWALEPLPPSDQAFLRGELDTRAVLALVQHAAVLVGGVGWLVPAGLAARTPLIVVCGGQGGHNAPEKITDPRMDLSRVRWLRPDPQCMCGNMGHDCPKEIPGFADRFEAALEELTPLPRERAPRAVPVAAPAPAAPAPTFPTDPLFDGWARDGLVWLPERGMGRLHVREAPYDRKYWEKYEGYAATPMGRAITAARVALVRRHVGPDEEVLDVGIGCGDFLDAYPGPRAGFDVNPVGIEWLTRRGLLRDPRQQDAHALTFWDVLEHIPDARAFVAAARAWLFCSVPIVPGEGPPRLDWKHLRRDEHCWYWTRGGLIRWMAEQGFRCVECTAAELLIGREDVETFAFQRVAP